MKNDADPIDVARRWLRVSQDTRRTNAPPGRQVRKETCDQQPVVHRTGAKSCVLVHVPR